MYSDTDHKINIRDVNCSNLVLAGTSMERLTAGSKTKHYTLYYTGCHRRKGPNFGRVFLMLNYTDITQNTYIQS